MKRRSVLLAFFALFASASSALAAIPKKFFMWFVVGRRLNGERKVLAVIADAETQFYDFPYGDAPATTVVVRDPALVWEEEKTSPLGGWEGRPSQDSVNRLMDAALVGLMGTATVEQAYASLFRPDDIVAIKVSWTVHLTTVDPVIRGLLSVGIPPDNIVLYDYRELSHAWWDRSPDKPQILAREPGYLFFNVYEKQYGVRIDGGHYANRIELVGTVQTRLEKLLYDCTALVNIACLKTHYLAETTLTIKNHQGSHRRPYALHASLDVSLPLLNALPPIREKTRLAILDATAPLYDGGPQTRNCPYTWKYNGLLASRDSVAVDTVGVAIIAEKRREMGLDDVMPRSHDLLMNAEMLNLGRHDPNKIDVIRIDL